VSLAIATETVALAEGDVPPAPVPIIEYVVVTGRSDRDDPMRLTR